MRIILGSIVAILLFSQCTSSAPLSTEKTDLQQYLGKWYEIAKLPNRFEKGLTCVTAEYSIEKEGRVEVFNKGYETAKSKYKSSKGYAKTVDGPASGKLKVTFFWPFFGDYYIIDHDDAYTYSLVGSPSRDYLWILAREPQLPQSTIDKLLAIAKEKGFDISKVEMMEHKCE